MILHLAVRADWEAGKREGSYPWSTRGVTVEQEGYTHCSFEHQWDEDRQVAPAAEPFLNQPVIEH